MTRIPSLSISQSGHLVGIGLGQTVLLVDPQTGQWRTEACLLTGSIIALAPTDTSATVVAAGQEIALLTAHDAADVHSLPGRAMQASVCDDFAVAVLTRSDTKGSHLCLFTGDSLAPFSDPVPLGFRSAHAFEMDSSHSVLVAGVQGQRAWDGMGEPYVCRINWSGGVAELDWQGAGLTDSVRAIKAGGARMLILHGNRLITSSIDSLIDHACVDGETVMMDGVVETIGIAPDGSWIAAIVNEDDQRRHLYTAPYGDTRLHDRGEIPDVGGAVLAVDGAGGATVAGRRTNQEVIVAVAPTDQKIEATWSIPLA